MSSIKDWLNSDLSKKSQTVIEVDVIEQSDSLYAKWDDSDGEESKQLTEQHRIGIMRRLMFILLFIVLMAFSAGFIITQADGYELSYMEVYRIIWDHIRYGAPDPDVDGWEAYFDDYVVWELRLPRIIIGMIAGFGLAVTGAVMQSTLKNPMADSYTTGVSSGAAFGAALAIVLGVQFFSGDWNFLFFAFVFSLVPTMLIMLLSRMRNMNATSMILTGMAVMYIFGACTTAIKLWAEPDALSALYRWQVGSLNNMKWDDFPLMFGITLVGSIVIMFLSNRINILSSGDESAKSLGIDANKLRIICLVTVSLITASIISYVGTIGFVGLVAPHIARIFIGNDNRFLIPAGAVFGGFLMMFSDYIGWSIIAPSVLEVGVVTAFIGGPMFLWLIIRQRKEVWA